MSFFSSFPACALAALAFPSAVSAASESTLLYSHKFWKVEFVAFDSGNVSCQMYSESRDSSIALSIWADDTGEISFQAFNAAWSMPTRDRVTIGVDVDYHHFVEHGASTSDQSVFVENLNTKFLNAVMRGKAIAIFSDRGERLITFSLAGSAAAMAKLAECWARILPSGSDPFRNATEDPFG